MQIKNQNFQIIITGKCNTKEDILQLLRFGYSKESIVKKYKKDNKVKTEDARRMVEQTMLEEAMRGAKEDGDKQ